MLSFGKVFQNLKIYLEGVIEETVNICWPLLALKNTVYSDTIYGFPQQ